MSAISWPSIWFHCLFGVFVYYQQRHARDFNGGSAVVGLLLSLFGFAGMLTGFAYYIYYGWTVTWWAPIVAFIFSILAMIPAALIERAVGMMTMSMSGFVIWPFAAYMMFRYIPN